MTRLSRAVLPTLRGVRIPAYDPAGITVGIVHLGVGAFHRAHQAVYTDAVLAADPTWGISGYTQRSAAVRDRLAPQDGLYTVLERGAGAGPPHVVGALREIRGPEEDGGPAARIADPRVRLVTLTVTEKGYRPDAPTVGRLVAGLDARRRADAGPVSVLSCDNLPANGATLRGLVADRCAALPDGERLLDWITTSVAFPSCVVDRIVPATTPADLAAAASALGVADEGAVVAEPFTQWVIEDAFAAGRPDWAATFTADVAPYEAAKLRLLNATHSLLAYTGALAGHDTIAAAMTDPALAETAYRFMTEDAVPTLTLPPGFDLGGYQDTILRRFADPALGHRTAQVAADGSLKLPIRLLGTARDRLAAGATPQWTALAVAAWMVYVATRQPLDDPIAGTLAAATAGYSTPASLVDPLLELLPPVPYPAWRDMLLAHTARLLHDR
ncbi:mannitol dehydrogenase family protein [Dactylosporangium aurantiacum]|uniref:Mannitol-1-phosphate 5-dehydrogenase n=1 Tax=Dactylosporangium aurantiacum TaxID=35754 RepID=A0A9Q9IBY3_9ACTN|nr:mannitol dehydrogenase family protein [Dactylosporangium aurantiacum]MDG6105027.1 mannitol dehydrogenase family protein [Dactylosporangium aurantiacum]UWZ51558.1 mannitol dehydrogenase family protein [Dactylosporangium aurantiacum]